MSTKSKLTFKMATLLLVPFSPCFAEHINCETTKTDGYNMVLMGNSFFRPYAEKLKTMAVDAGFDNHQSTGVFRGGENGRPINLWQDSLSQAHLQIKSALDQGNVAFFGMTAGHDADNPTEGHSAWIEYALQNNPDITIFISIPPIDHPASWDQFANDNGFNSIHELYDFYVNEIVHKTLVDPLRAEFPSTKIFTVPTGWAALQLEHMQQNDELLDDVALFGPLESSIFTDMKGHQGQIVRETGGLLWLNNIYNVDLTSSDYTTGFKTDLHQIADDIVQAHDPDYRLCHQQTAGGQPMVTSDSTYDVLVEENVEYGQGLTHDGISALPTAKPLLLDVYVPDNDSTNRPVYMFIHGGGFNGGSKTAAHILDMAHFFASRGWVFVSINYRTSEDIGTIHTGIVPPEWEAMITDPNNIAQGIAIYTAQRDAKAAMRWIAANAEDYQINRDFITVGGGSAGAITAITLGISNQEDFRDEISIAEDPTLLSTHLEQNYEIKSIVDFWGGNIALEILEMVYGHQRFDSEDPELLIVHGTEDPAVLFSEAEELVALYGGTGAYVELVPLFGLGHGVWNAIFEGKTLAELSFDFLVKQQKLITQTSAHDDIFKNTFE